MSNFNRNGGRSPVGPSLNPPKLPEFKTDFDQQPAWKPEVPGMDLPRRPGLGTSPFKPRPSRFEGAFGAGSKPSDPIAPRPTLPQGGGSQSQGGEFARPQSGGMPGQGSMDQRKTHWNGRLSQLQKEESFVDPTNEWENDDWQSLYSTDDDVTADGGDRWMRQMSSGSRAKLKDTVPENIKVLLSRLDPAEYGSVIKEAGLNPADYLEEEEYERVSGASPIPEAWMAEVELWDPEFQQAYEQAYAQGNERASQRIRNMARAAMYERDWMPQPQAQQPQAPAPQPTYSTQPVHSPQYDDIREAPPARPTTPTVQSLVPSAPWDRPDRYGY